MYGKIGPLFTGLVAASALLVPAGAPSPAPSPTTGPAPMSSPATGPARAPAPASPGAASRLDWKACTGENLPEGIRCATVTVPVDWRRPRGRKLTLDLARLPATDPANRIGSVLQVPGGPGAEGVRDLKDSAPGLTELRRRFDLVGYNPRNTGLRERLPAVCWGMGTQLLEPRDREEYRAQVARVEAAARECRDADSSGLFDNLDSLSVARDMEAVREALGERRLSFMANSYGGVPAAAYARLFPGRIRAMYLDGAADQVNGWARFHLDHAAVGERMFGRFLAWCAADGACALHGEDVSAVWRALVEKLDRSPIPISSPELGEGKLTGWHLRLMSFQANPGPDNAWWKAFATSVDRLRKGDASGFAEAVNGNSRIWAVPALRAMTCPDDRGFTGYEQFRDVSRRVREASPHLGAAPFDMLGCAGWPRPVANPSRPLPVRGLPPFLGAGSWTDHAMTASLAGTVPGSVTVLYDGPGHVLYMPGNNGPASRCVIGHATRYLVDLTLPAPGTVCRPGE
ncbi:alpha/beta fold hydrolase [Streptosporangium sp. NPDC023963]|uniref:alpha/beta fold hydrolase n=1 Tax=Streptosporangium sp. NPDC023963 TaxID=3155608 RepID=UPI00342F2F70